MKKVIIVHAIDTEGPLYETIHSKFERINEIVGKINIKPTKKNLEKLLNGKIKLPKNKLDKIFKMFSKHLSAYNEDWEQIDKMLSSLMSKDFRKKYSKNNSCWKFTWYCLDHLNFEYNPRRRTLGHHAIFDHYQSIIKNFNYGDDIQWHFHPSTTHNDAHYCSTSYFRTPLIFDILTRKVIERNFFPSSFRAGFQSERPDSHWFLEQWIPFDITNMSVKEKKHFDKYLDFKNGRSGNWRNAPSDWSIYHPAHDDYQKVGKCRRWIGRALNILNRIASISQSEVDKAFKKAKINNSAVLLGVASHDWRNIETEVEHVFDLIQKSSKKYPDVSYEFCNVDEGFRKTIWPRGIKEEKLKLKIRFNKETKNDVSNLIIEAKQGKVFGPQPFLAIKTKSRNFIYDNLDFISENKWGYAFYENTVMKNEIDEIAVAANDKFGNTSIDRIKF
tara:strand:+ start:1084 stop:2418 length:1335 start_codon:yes stop_codon:yes gene_type:complete